MVPSAANAQSFQYQRYGGFDQWPLQNNAEAGVLNTNPAAAAVSSSARAAAVRIGDSKMAAVTAVTEDCGAMALWQRTLCSDTLLFLLPLQPATCKTVSSLHAIYLPHLAVGPVKSARARPPTTPHSAALRRHGGVRGAQPNGIASNFTLSRFEKS